MPNLAARLTWIITTLCTAIGGLVARQTRVRNVVWLGTQAYVEVTPPARLPPLPVEIWSLLSQRLARLSTRFTRLYDRWRAGTLPVRRAPRPARSGPARSGHPPSPAPRLPRAIGWANQRIPEAAPPTGHLEALLRNPETREFVAAAPQAGRLLRPLCRALGVNQPDWLRLPTRPRTRPAKRAPAPTAQPPNDRPLPRYVVAAIRAARKNRAP